MLSILICSCDSLFPIYPSFFRIHEVTDALLSKLVEKIEDLVVVFYDMEVPKNYR